MLNPGDLLVTESVPFVGSRIHRVDPVTGGSTQIAELRSEVFALAVQADGMLVGVQRDFVFRLDPSTGIYSVISDDPAHFAATGIAIEVSGNLLVSALGAGPNNGRVVRVDSASGAATIVSSGGIFASGVNAGPFGISLDPDSGDAFVGVRGAAILDIDRVTGTQTTVSSGGFLNTPNDYEVDAIGNLIVADSNGLLRIDRNTGSQTRILSGSFDSIALDFQGDYILTSFHGQNVSRVDPLTGSQTVIASFSGNPWGLAVVPTATVVPEPSSLSLYGLVMFGLLVMRRVRHALP